MSSIISTLERVGIVIGAFLLCAISFLVTTMIFAVLVGICLQLLDYIGIWDCIYAWLYQDLIYPVE